MDDLTYEVRIGKIEQPRDPREIAFAHYDPSLPVRMVIRAKPKRFPAKWWMKLLKWLKNYDQNSNL